MYFTSGGYARKNGFRFELKYSGYLNGVHQENPWYLYVSRPDPVKDTNEGCYTEYSLRFATQDDAKAFCDRIADGEITIEQLQAAETDAYQQHQDKLLQEAKDEFLHYASQLYGLGVDPTSIPDVYRIFSALSPAAQKLALDKTYLSAHTTQITTPIAEQMQTFGEVFFEQQRDMDVCLLDKDLGDYFLSAICYLDPSEIQPDIYDYTAKEKWLFSLELSHVSKETGCPLAVLKTDFDHEQVAFLLGIPQFDSPEWAEQSMRAVYSGADFSARLKYLQDGTLFEVPFDGNHMDASNPQQRMELCQLLSAHDAVYITKFPGSEDDYYAYAIEKSPNGHIITSEIEVPISYTEPGKGLTSTLEGKIYWAKHVGALARTATQTSPQAEKITGKEVQ